MSLGELERLTRRYTAGIIHTLGPDSDVPAPDVNTNERVMAWVMDTYSMHHRHTVTAVVTGKPVEMGGSLGRREATGRGCMIVTKEALRHLGMKVAGTTVAVQGFGNVGSVAAQLLAREGCKVSAISDRTGAYYNKNGIDVEAAVDVREAEPDARRVHGWRRDHQRGAAHLRRRRAAARGARERDHEQERRAKIQAKIVCEGANGPTTAGADSILDEKEIFVIPDILANAGGVTVSYFEWVQDRGGYFWSEDTVNERLTDIMRRSFAEVLKLVDAAQGEHAHGGLHDVDQPRRRRCTGCAASTRSRECDSSSPSWASRATGISRRRSRSTRHVPRATGRSTSPKCVRRAAAG